MADHDESSLIVAKTSLDDIYNIFTVPSGKTLFLLLESVKPDLILLDIEMSDMDGYEIINTLKRSEKTANIPVILLFTKIDPGRGMNGMGMGAAGCLAKPLTGKLLVKQVEMHLQKKEIQRKNNKDY